jgi:Asp-tRNA(Asn)/Glu-tRNA(Gln) amidotransferase A subunit family amidase
MIAAAAQLAGLSFTEAERELMRDALQQQLESYERLRSVPIDNAIPPALGLVLPAGEPVAAAPDATPPQLAQEPAPEPPAEGLAFATLSELARLIRGRAVSSVELTELYLRRLKQYDPLLKCVVTLTEDLALEQARRADAELAAGRYRGPLHGIPWGAKDLLATRGIRTTWGAAPFRDQVIDEDATVVRRLEDAGAVLVAKLTLGELAWGDIWFGGMTRNPWNTAEGSSGSSAGSAAAAAAGLAGFTIGTETWGSIVSPSTRCGVSGLRPTYGRVSRAGAMALSWSMDKIGPIARSAEDCALVFAAIHGPDGRDLSVADRPFHWNPQIDLRKLRVGYLARAFEQEYEQQACDLAALEVLRGLGAKLIPIELPDIPSEALMPIMWAEAAAAFDELTRDGRDELLARQGEDAWPNRLRAARLIPAVEYIQANRLRTQAMRALEQQLAAVDLYVAPSFDPANLLLTNLTGHPAVVVPNGHTADGGWSSISLIGRLYDEATILAVAKAYQDATDFHLRHPPLP